MPHRSLSVTWAVMWMALAPSARMGADPPPPQDPVHAFQRQLHADMPVGNREPRDRIGDPAPRQPWPGADASHHDLPYLGLARDRLHQGAVTRRQREAGHPVAFAWRARADIHVPPGDGPFPCLVLLHGGAYAEGDKAGPGWIAQRDRDIRTVAMSRGWVVVSANYLLGTGIHPQVQRDTRELVRFLRAHAAAYRIDPHRIALVGSSAGGWLAGASSLTTVDDGWIMSADWRYRTSPLSGPPSGRYRDHMLLAGEAATIAHERFSSRISALMVDFLDGQDAASADDPHVLTFTGGGTSKNIPGLPQFTVVNLPGRDTTDIHVPDTSLRVASSRGGEVSLFERCLEFIEDHLAGPQARAAAPEARPQQRWFAESVAVELVGSGPGTVIHYTTDGSEPTTASPRYAGPIQLNETTELRAIAVVGGMQPSGPMRAHFLRGLPPPEITGPEGLVLPPAQVGQPYEVTFTAPGAQRWQIIVSSHSVTSPDIPARGRERDDHLLRHGLGVHLGLRTVADGDRASLQGMPLRPGWVTVLVAAAHAQGEGCPVAGDRLYLLRVDPAQ